MPMAMAMASPAAAPPELLSRDALIAWFRGEFAAANAIIDALCAHLAQIGGGSDYEAAFAALHRRRMNWIPVVHMQRYFSIADVAAELRHIAATRTAPPPMKTMESVEEPEIIDPPKEIVVENAKGSAGEQSEEYSSADSSDRKIENDDGDSGGGHSPLQNARICSDHEDCVARPERIKTSKGFVAKEPVKGHMVNVVKGLKMYEDIFTDSELVKLAEFINELRLAGRRGELSGETFIFFNKQMKGNKREIIQLGVPLFQTTKEEAKSNNEHIPPVLQTVIDHLVQWRLIPENKMPNSCVINFFDEDEYSQPYFKPPHFDNPISTLFLSDATMAFGRVLVTDNHGNYKGSLTLPLKQGSLLVMRGNSADMARHVVCPSATKRVSITFVRVRPTTTTATTTTTNNISNNKIDDTNNPDPSLVPPLARAMMVWQPNGLPAPHKVVGAMPHGVVPSWELSPVFMPMPMPMAMPMSTEGRFARSSGTGVFLPWTVAHKKYTKHLPPRIQKRRLMSLPSAQVV